MTLEELKDSDFVVGMKETERAIEKREASAVFIASDCDERISAPLLSACQASRHSRHSGIHQEGDRPRVWHQSESRCCRCPEETLISSAFLKDPR